MEQTIEVMDKDFHGFCFVNLVDFDALWGHRRNPVGYGQEIERFDVNLGVVLSKLKEDDLLILTADHGNDPTFKGTDHTKERVPFLAYSPSMKGNGKLPAGDTFAVIGATVADNFGVKMPEGTIGYSCLLYTSQHSNTELMIFTIDKIVSELSKGMTLKAGTIISTGTPAGVGMGFTPPKFLKEGDTVECIIEKIGKIKNVVSA